MPRCIVMAGLPGTGKSTRVRDLVTMNPDSFVYSTDNYIEECCRMNGWTYDQGFAEFIEPATKRMNEFLNIAMKCGQDVIWDQTNTGTKKRANTVRLMEKANYIVECEVIRPPLDSDEVLEWEHRLADRPGKTIPRHILKSMSAGFTMPSLDEGFDAIRVFDMWGNLEETIYRGNS